jgi:hypothetical protein
LPAQAGLAQVSAGAPALLRAVRTQSGTRTSVSFIVRVYAPDATSARAAPVTITFPSLPAKSTLQAVVVTALEEPAGGPPVTVAGSTLTFTPTAALTTVQVTVTGPGRSSSQG